MGPSPFVFLFSHKYAIKSDSNGWLTDGETNRQTDRTMTNRTIVFLALCSNSCSYCLDVFKVATILSKIDGFLVEEPLEGHIQRRVMRGLAAQHHALPHGHFHSVRAELHTHGLWKHKAATLSPQANQKLASRRCIPLPEQFREPGP